MARFRGADPEADTTIRKPAGRFTSSFRAETCAVDIALEFVEQVLAEQPAPQLLPRVHIFTDSESLIKSLAGGPEQQSTVTACRIWERINRIAGADNGGCTLLLQWVPGHAGLEMNELADAAAREASELPQDGVPIDYTTAAAAIKRLVKKEWERGAKPSVRGAKLVPPQLEAGLNRSERRVLAQFRTGGKCWKLAKYRAEIAKAGEQVSPICERCQTGDEDVAHVLNDCPAYTAARLRHFGASEDNIRDLFENPMRVVQFLREVGITRAGNPGAGLL